MDEDESRDPSAQEALDVYLESRLAELHTALPGRIERYDPAKQQADVQPLLKRKYRTEDGEQLVELPVITNVPVWFPRAGGAFVSMPVKAGDTVLLLFAERSLDKWLIQGGMVDPADVRKHHLSDAIALPGLAPFGAAIPNAHADDVVIALEDGTAEFHLTPDGTVWVKCQAAKLGAETAAKALALAERVDAELNAQRTWALAHTHGTGVGPSTPPVISPPAVATTASTRAFADA